ncbi:hypothetical protein NEMIN01_2288 [Nematocida minor]|uniref:uncharacterized protein n=1 Tax=Nematocida minor TaxID=1912983 RepID=UPI00221E6829|nr:uncharacterized protein NEMIN01_2288 [Nematocida minor]KAI5192918.1 hypothetical protein NEMIN01_2288 [Nematocida minor]
MVTREVKLKVNVEGIVKSALSIKNKYDQEFYNTSSEQLRHLTILKDIFDGNNLEIESDHSEEEKKVILDTLRKDIYLYFIENGYQVPSMQYLYSVLKGGRDASIRSEAILLANHLIKQNPFIYRPDHGICRKSVAGELFDDINPENAAPDLSTRTYTLEIDATKFVNLRSLMEANAESLSRQNYLYVDTAARFKGIDVLKKHVHLRKFYTLDDLYTKEYEDTKTSLLDYGLELICRKYHDIEKLSEEIEEPKIIYKGLQDDIADKINKVFVQEELEIVIPILDDIKKIGYEKSLHKSIIYTLEYLVNNTALLKEPASGLNVLHIKKDLSDFYEDNVTGKGLEKIVDDKVDEITREMLKHIDSLNRENEEYTEKEARLQRWMEEYRNKLNTQIYNKMVEEKNKEMQEAVFSINDLNNKIYLLACDKERETIRSKSLVELKKNLKSLPELTLLQKQHLLEKIKQFAKVHNVKVEEEEPARSLVENVKSTGQFVFRLLTGACVLSGFTLTAFNHFSNIDTMQVGDVHNVLNSNQFLCHKKQSLTKKH